MTETERIETLEREVAELKAALSGEADGYYTSKYSGEEIDALLDKVAAMDS